MTINNVLTSLLLSLAFILTVNTAVFACSCKEAGPVLDQVERSEFIIVGRLTSAYKAQATIEVDRVFKGSIKVGEQLDFVNGGHGDCSRGYSSKDIGQKYLFYLSKPDEGFMFNPSLCGRSNLIERAFDDLAYLEQLPKVAGKTRLSGYFKTRETTSPNVEDLVVKITGKKSKKSYSLKSDKNGFFEIYDLAPGDYIVEPQIPIGWRIDTKYMFGIDSTAKSYLVTIKAKRHTASKITLTKDDSHSAYPAIWFAPIKDANKPDWEILPQEARDGEVSLSKRNELGILSNFAATPFVRYGKRVRLSQ